ncbi:recombination protein RecR [Candidatus Parcubacteria bacterium]|nr:MAG: recombination protein RecR [Candidatus Parcubacteria bacterium]
MLTRLPAVGPKTAERYVFWFLQQNSNDLQEFAQTIAELKENTLICKSCFAVSDTNPCDICVDKKRNHQLISVVSNTRDMISIESTKTYNGIYLVLGGVLNPIKGIEPKNLKVKALLEKIKENKATEVILCLNPNIEGETTSIYLAKQIKNNFPKVTVTKLARGLAMGADLEYADEQTLNNALKFRNKI